MCLRAPTYLINLEVLADHVGYRVLEGIKSTKAERVNGHGIYCATYLTMTEDTCVLEVGTVLSSKSGSFHREE